MREKEMDRQIDSLEEAGREIGTEGAVPSRGGKVCPRAPEPENGARGGLM